MIRTIAKGIVPALMCVAVVIATTTVGPAGAITNGQLDGTAHPNVGVMVVDFGAGPRRLCSGELIAPTRFLTAGHCTSFLVNNPALLGVTFDPTYNPITSTVIPAVSVTVDPQFGKDKGDFHDLGVTPWQVRWRHHRLHCRQPVSSTSSAPRAA